LFIESTHLAHLAARDGYFAEKIGQSPEPFQIGCAERIRIMAARRRRRAPRSFKGGQAFMAALCAKLFGSAIPRLGASLSQRES
jgi:hypothetical protein